MRISHLFALRNTLKNENSFLSSVKGHLSCHMPYQWPLLGPPQENDTNEGKSGHKVDKLLYEGTSKRYSTSLSEMIKLVSIHSYYKVLSLDML
jgi:hypothetical protein